MPPVIAISGRLHPPGYRRLGKQWLRLDMAEKLLREAHGARMTAGGKPFALDPARAVSMGLTTAGYAQLLRLAGSSRCCRDRFGKAPTDRPRRWPGAGGRRAGSPPRTAPRAPPSHGAFASLAELVR